MIREREVSSFPSPAQLLTLLVAYFTLHVIIRTLLSSSVDLDESEQVMLTQKFSWGYGTDPPVYTWIQMLFFDVFGRGVFALALWKNLALLTTYGFVYGSGRLLTRSHQGGAVAALSLLFMPHVVWESQRDLTHTILACASATAMLFCLLRAHATKQSRWYVALGLCIGVGLLSKFNFGLWAAGLLLAGLSLREFRATLLTPRMLLALGLGLLLVSPYYAWALQHRDLAAHTTGKLGVQGSKAWRTVVGIGLGHLLQAVAAFVLPPGVIYVLVFLRPTKRAAQPSPYPAGAKLLLRAFVLILSLLVLLVICFRATGFRERWFEPILVSAPVLGVALLGDRVTAQSLRWMSALGLVAMVLVACLIPGRILFMERLKREEPLARPYAEVAQQLRAALPASMLLVSDTTVLGGNLQLALPEQRITTPDLLPVLGNGAPHCAIVWEANGHDQPPKALAAWAESVHPEAWARVQPQYFTAIYKFHHARQFRLGLAVLY